jgi:hypothetical protein
MASVLGCAPAAVVTVLALCHLGTFSVSAGAHEKRTQSRPARLGTACKTWAKNERGNRVCVACLPGFLLKGGWCKPALESPAIGKRDNGVRGLR